MENYGAKGHPSDEIHPGETKVLLNTKGAGIVNRIWITIVSRSGKISEITKIFRMFKLNF